MKEILYEVRDPIHGFILFDDLERDLINSRPYQRLRRIKQLAMTHLVYPGATHTRFEHSLGVMEFATRIFDTLHKKDPNRFRSAFGLDSEGQVERARRILRLAALLHDIGHTPFSHAPEGMLSGGHERMSARIIREASIRSIIEEKHHRFGVHVEDIIPVILSKEPEEPFPGAMTQFQNELITGVFGADRIDYLLRDSLHAGVRYGEFDAQRLIHTLTLILDPETSDPVLAMERGGVHSAGSLLQARFLMFQQVYYHAVRRIYDHHLGQALKEILPDGRFPEDVDAYLRWDDPLVETRMAELALGGSPSEAAGCFMERNHFRRAFEAPEGQVGAYRPHESDLTDELRGEFGDAFHVDSEERQLARATELGLPIVSDDEVVSRWADESALFRTLPPLGFFRVFVRNDPDLVQRAGEFCKDFFEDRITEREEEPR